MTLSSNNLLFVRILVGFSKLTEQMYSPQVAAMAKTTNLNVDVYINAHAFSIGKLTVAFFMRSS